MDRRLGERTFHLEPIYRDDFRITDPWRLEGVGARLWTGDGWLWCDARADQAQGATIWCTAAEFTDPLWLEFDVRFLDGMFNSNLILHARASQGQDVLAPSSPRCGSYSEYHAFPNYIVTFLNDQDATRIRYRRNPGFGLLGETFYRPALVLDRVYHVVLLLSQGRMEFWVDWQKRFEGVDPSPLNAGRFAWRTWKTLLGWSNLSVCRAVI